ncbi:hypothetical protein Cgig2_017607 [Carnegiea gigantea]|uniref:Endonuclease/exonuclease/phosphatase domain-containing protein n=1 Tax=Carnegiea gigantea TaxID=171969 RepID=A0A9Q1JH67_9CARY|nr:hypothetical protein Cgig2_017607 [Carnegiea gigantea]
MTERGRIILCWHPRRYHFGSILKTDQLLHEEAMHLSTNMKVYLTLVYGRNLEDQRLPLWEDLRSLAQSLEDPKCVLGDFNSILRLGERIGRVEVTEGETRDFATCIKQCGLMREPFSFGQTKQSGQELTGLFTMNSGMKTRDKDFKDMVKHSLAHHQRGSSLKILQHILSNLRHYFRQLNKNKYADIYTQQAKARSDLLQAQSPPQEDTTN